MLCALLNLWPIFSPSLNDQAHFHHFFLCSLMLSFTSPTVYFAFVLLYLLTLNSLDFIESATCKQDAKLSETPVSLSHESVIHKANPLEPWPREWEHYLQRKPNLAATESKSRPSIAAMTITFTASQSEWPWRLTNLAKSVYHPQLQSK